jgi:hypothetical protein
VVEHGRALLALSALAIGAVAASFALFDVTPEVRAAFFALQDALGWAFVPLQLGIAAVGVAALYLHLKLSHMRRFLDALGTRLVSAELSGLVFSTTLRATLVDGTVASLTYVGSRPGDRLRPTLSEAHFELWAEAEREPSGCELPGLRAVGPPVDGLVDIDVTPVAGARRWRVALLLEEGWADSPEANVLAAVEALRRLSAR